jgi:hypothetical protein
LDYRQRVKALADALAAAHNAHVELLSLVSDLNGQDVAWSTLVPMQAERLFGHNSDRLGVWFRDALAAGYVAKTDIPKGIEL